MKEGSNKNDRVASAERVSLYLPNILNVEMFESAKKADEKLTSAK